MPSCGTANAKYALGAPMKLFQSSFCPVAGLGVALRSEWDVAPSVKRGELRRLFVEYEFEGADILALVPTRRGVSARISHFVESLKTRFQPKPPWRSI